MVMYLGNYKQLARLSRSLITLLNNEIKVIKYVEKKRLTP